MKKISLSEGEWKLMNLLWDLNPRTVGEMTSLLKADTGWTKATVNVMLNRLAEKEAVRIEKGEKVKLVYPIATREEAVVHEAVSTLGKIRTDSIALLISTMAKESKLSAEEIDELLNVLKEAKHD